MDENVNRRGASRTYERESDGCVPFKPVGDVAIPRGMWLGVSFLLVFAELLQRIPRVDQVCEGWVPDMHILDGSVHASKARCL